MSGSKSLEGVLHVIYAYSWLFIMISHGHFCYAVSLIKLVGGWLKGMDHQANLKLDAVLG